MIKEALAKIKKILKKKAKIEDDDLDNISKGSDEQEPQVKKVKKRRRTPSGAKLYKSS